MTSYFRIPFIFAVLTLAAVPAAAESVSAQVSQSKPSAIAPFKDGEAKVYVFDDWNIENRIIFSKLRVTLIHNATQKAISLRVSFHQYNKTENDKGTHTAGLTLQLLGSSDNILAVHFGGNNITRDACRDLGDRLLGPDNIPDDIWDLVTSSSLSYSATWDYEGAC